MNAPIGKAVEVPSSRRRLTALAAVAVLCTAATLWLLAIVVMMEVDASLQRKLNPDLDFGPNWVPLALLIFAILFGAWALAAAFVAARMPARAYRFDATGVVIGDADSHAFRWQDVKGATLARGKRRSAVAVILKDAVAVNTAGQIPALLATFLGRPTDRDVALTNMDTRWQLQPFLDLIQDHLDTYGQIRLTPPLTPQNSTSH